MVKFFIPGLPVAKQRPKFAVRGGFARAYTPAKTRDYENLVKSIAQKSILRPLEGPLCVDLVFYMPIPKSTPKGKCLENTPHTKRPDADNLGKLVLDALNGVAWLDDSQVFEIHIKKLYSENPRTEVKIGHE